MKKMYHLTRRAALILPAAAYLARPSDVFAANLSNAADAYPIPEINAALERMYNFDFPGAHKRLDAFIAANPTQPLGYSFRAAAHLFSEFDRLRILEAEFLTSDEKIHDDNELTASPQTRDAFNAAVATSRKLAEGRKPVDNSALFALCINEGLTADYIGLVDKSRLGSLPHAKNSQTFALNLLKKDPAFVDAKLTSGISEYLIGSLPFFVKWFVKLPQVDGDKNKAVANLSAVAADGRYLGPFARILLAIVHLREKRPTQSLSLLQGLVRDFPENPLLRKELAKLTK
jgi:hypothetical protein